MIVENALVRSTVRVMAGKDGEEPFSVGTGFIIKFNSLELEMPKS